MTEQATSAASTAATTVTSAASGVAENVFSMFGGGPKKEKVDDEDRGENSGSAKAQKAKDAEENPEVGHNKNNNPSMPGIIADGIRIGRSSRVRGCPLRACHPSHRES